MKKFIILIILISILSIVCSNASLGLEVQRSYKEVQRSYKYDNNKPIITCNSIVVDSDGNLYIENGSQVQVYDSHGVFSHSIKINTSGAIRLGIDENDQLHVAIARQDNVLVFDRQGYIIKEIPDEQAKLYREYEKRNSKFHASDRSVYSITRFFGYITVSKSLGESIEKVYSMPFSHWIIKYLLLVLIILCVPLPLIIMICINFGKKNKEIRKRNGLKFWNYYSSIKFGQKQKRIAEKLFRNSVIEVNLYRNDFFSNFFTILVLLILITLNMSYISWVGYNSIGLEYAASFMIVFTLYIVIDILVSIIRYYTTRFIVKSNDLVEECSICKNEKPDLWIFSMKKRPRKIVCHVCNREYKEVGTKTIILTTILGTIFSIGIFVLFMYLLSNVNISFRIVICVFWGIATWYFSMIMMNICRYNRVVFTINRSLKR